MAQRSQSDLTKIGMEGFALIDQYYGRKSRPQFSSSTPPSSAANFVQNQQISHYRFYPQESYFRYHQPKEESQIVRITEVSTTEGILIRRSSTANERPSSAAAKPFRFPNYNY